MLMMVDRKRSKYTALGGFQGRIHRTKFTPIIYFLPNLRV